KILSNSNVKLQIYSLHLSNTYKCNRINPFLSRLSLNKFPQLRSLTLLGVKEDQVENLQQILPLIPQLFFLHLIQPAHSVTNILIKCSMSKLRILAVTDSYQHLELIDQISSITNLTITNCNFHSLQRILKTVTMLKYLNCSNLFQRQISSNNSIQFKEDYQCNSFKTINYA
ncbi:unnamed protein product, partial [Rotaria sordida]